jgi:uncharacterized protein DUF3489
MRGSTAKGINTAMKNAEAANTTETAAVAELGAQVEPEKAPSKKGASQKKNAPKSQKTAKGAKPKAAPPKKTTPTQKTAKAPKKAAKTPESAGPREGSKTAQVVAMLQRKNGATLAEIMEKMGWQKHTVRGFMAGAMKKAGYTVESFKSDKGERTYRINQ